MKNTIVCPHCKSENPFYKSICSNCNSFIRERTVNLDLWKTIGLLIENPTKAFEIIVFSEHKNFTIFIILFSVAKLLIDARFISMITLGVFQSTVGIWLSYLVLLPAIFIIIGLLSIIFKTVSKYNEIDNRTKDNFALMSFSLVPSVFGLLVLFPFELIIFGDYLFSLNPTPFVIKEFFAYLFLFIEVFLIIWTIFLSVKAFFVQTKNRTLSFSYAIIFNFLIGLTLYYSSKIIFTI